jgi:hypothetical protein
MSAAYITAFRNSLENLRVETVPDPVVTAGEANVKILAASVEALTPKPPKLSGDAITTKAASAHCPSQAVRNG